MSAKLSAHSTGDYTTVTEVPGNKVDREQIERISHRYQFAAEFCNGRDVLEVACGAGLGLGILAEKARKVWGGDIDPALVDLARRHYAGRKHVEIQCLDAEKLPFDEESFDTVILHEAIYYLKRPEVFIQEAHRVLRSGGTLIIGTVNKNWDGFNPSPFSVRYLSASDLPMLLSRNFSEVRIHGAFPASRKTWRDRGIALLKRVAVTFHLIPRTMKGKALLKRIFFGKLSVLPAEIDPQAFPYIPPPRIEPGFSEYQYKILYAVGRKE